MFDEMHVGFGDIELALCAPSLTDPTRTSRRRRRGGRCFAEILTVRDKVSALRCDWSPCVPAKGVLPEAETCRELAACRSWPLTGVPSLTFGAYLPSPLSSIAHKIHAHKTQSYTVARPAASDRTVTPTILSPIAINSFESGFWNPPA